MQSHRLSQRLTLFPSGRGRNTDPENPQIRQDSTNIPSVQQDGTEVNSSSTPQLEALGQTQQTTVSPPSAPAGDNTKDGMISNSSNKFWSIYIDEAEKIDNTLVEEWAGTADSILIFSGLFSAVVTSFLIESFGSLQPDMNEQIVDALITISAQLASSNTGSGGIPTYTPPDPDLFRPQATALWINGLWLSSLTLSLITAVIATLIRQWAAAYRHSVTHDQVPHRRGAIRQYLFDGLRKWRMPDVIDFIPLLIQITLVLFLSGLALYLWDMNRSLATLVIVLSVVLSLIYVLCSLGTLISFKFPYHTPLSQSINALISHITHAFADDSKSAMRVSEIYQRAAERDMDCILKEAFKFVIATVNEEKEVEKLADSLPSLLKKAKKLAKNEGTLGELSKIFLSNEARTLAQMIDESELAHDGDQADRNNVIATLLDAISSALSWVPAKSVIGNSGLEESWFNRCLNFFSHLTIEVAQHSMHIYALLVDSTLERVSTSEEPTSELKLSSQTLKLLRDYSPSSKKENSKPWKLLLRCFETSDPNSTAFIRKVWPSVYKEFAKLDATKSSPQLSNNATPQPRKEVGFSMAFASAATVLLDRHRQDTHSYYNGLTRDILRFVRACYLLKSIGSQMKNDLDGALQTEHGGCTACKELYQELQRGENCDSSATHDSGHA